MCVKGVGFAISVSVSLSPPVSTTTSQQLQGVQALQPVYLLTDPYLNAFRRWGEEREIEDLIGTSSGVFHRSEQLMLHERCSQIGFAPCCRVSAVLSQAWYCCRCHVMGAELSGHRSSIVVCWLILVRGRFQTPRTYCVIPIVSPSCNASPSYPPPRHEKLDKRAPPPWSSD